MRLARVAQRGGALIALTGLTVSSIALVAAPVAAAVGSAKPKPAAVKKVDVDDAKPVAGPAVSSAYKKAQARADGVSTRKVKWPNARKRDLSPDPQGSKATASLGAVTVAGGDSWSGMGAAVIDHETVRKAGVEGVAVSLSPTKSQVAGAARANGKSDDTFKVTLDYTDLTAGFGGDWAGRLQPLVYPACVLSTPEKAACQDFQPAEVKRDVKAEELTAVVSESDLAGASTPGTTEMVVLFAATTSSSTGGGDFSATPLKASSSWSQGGSSGGFTWSYPFRIPSSAAGDVPGLSIDYSSQAVDGLTATTNNQASALGEGFDLSSAYIERSYVSCNDDGREGKTDLCFKTDNATLAMADTGGKLVKASDGTWRLQSDDGTRVRRLASSADSGHTNIDSTAALNAANPDNNNEYWEVTTPDGTRYYFGRSLVPGQSGNTNSVWTVPVYGNNAGEPCYDGAKVEGQRYCANQAWRWNLDYVVDPSGNAMAYRYATEQNHYRLNNATPTEYTRGGRLDRIDYGLKDGTDGGTTNQSAPYRVDLSYAVRCLAATGCETYSATKWPDTPYDQICAAGAECTGKASPSFFTRWRLDSVATKVRNGSTYADIDTWKLGYNWVNAGETTDSVLWLDSITQAGKGGVTAPGTITLPSVKFAPTQLQNRVDNETDGISSLPRYRLASITSETGARTTVQYSDEDCTPGDKPAAAHTNQRRCYPQKWTPPTDTATRTDWFHKYVVVQVQEVDVTTTNDPVVTSYAYEGGTAWAYNDGDRLTADKYRTWSTWRGYRTVRTTTGDPDLAGARGQSVKTYFRGMNGDHLPAADDGTARSRNVSVTASNGTAYTDKFALAGKVLESQELTGVGGSVHRSTISEPWVHVTAGTGRKAAAFVRTDATLSKERISGGGFREGKTTMTYDTSTGQATRVSDHGDLAVGDDQTCTATAYADVQTVNGAWFIGFESKTARSTGLCGADALTPAESKTLSITRTRYDGKAQGAAPSRGLVTETDRVKSFNTAGDPVFQQTMTADHDGYGRVTSVATPAGNGATKTNTTSYVHSANGTLSSKTDVEDAGGKAFATETTFAPEWGVPLTVKDPNIKSTTVEYDALGRTIKAWGTDRSTTATPTVKFAYKLSQTEASAVTTSSLNTNGTGYRTSVTIYDALLRVRQTQVPSAAGGRLVSGAAYNSRGKIDYSYDRLYTAGDPSTTRAVVEWGGPSHQAETTYDGLGRPTKVTEYSHSDVLWSTATAYPGVEKTKVTPPKGAPAVTTETDLKGRLVKHIEHGGGGTGADADLVTTYKYDLDGNLRRMVGPGGTFTWDYDLRGRKTSQSDPDAGTSTFTYTENDLLATSTDARGKSTLSVYDVLDRPLALYGGMSATDSALRTGWTYDAPMKGFPAETYRYVGGRNGTVFTEDVMSYSAAYAPLAEKFSITKGAEADASLTEGLPTSLTRQYRYNVDRSLAIDYLPGITINGVSQLSAEAVSHGYDALGNPLTVAGSSTIVRDVDYDGYNQASMVTLGRGPDQELYVGREHQEATGRLTRLLSTTSVSEQVVADHHYTYDAAGNPTRDYDRANGDAQCYDYDSHQRLTAAWTPADANCGTAVGSAVLGGPAAYAQTWTYTATGLRKTQTSTLPGVGTEEDVTVTDTYSYPDAGTPHANFATTVTRTESQDAVWNYGFNDAGQTIARPGSTEGTPDDTDQQLTWDAEGDLESLTTTKADGSSGETTKYVYDAGGEVLMTDSASKKTLSVFGHEITITKPDSAVEGSAAGAKVERHYETALGSVAVRTGNSTIGFQVSDQHATAEVFVDGASMDVTRRYLTPFGQERQTIAAKDTQTSPAPLTEWPTARGFLDKRQDAATGLVSVGARQYDAVTGRFLSVDPVLDTTDPQQTLAYLYANNNPVTFSDPTGLQYKDDHGPGNNHESSTDWKCVFDPSCGYGTSENYDPTLGGLHEPDGTTGDGNDNPYTSKDDPASGSSLASQGGSGWLAEAKRRAREAKRKVLEAATDLDAGIRRAGEAVAAAGQSVWDWADAHANEIVMGLTVVGVAACIIASAGLCAAVTVAGIAASGFAASGGAGERCLGCNKDFWTGAGKGALVAVTGKGLGRAVSKGFQAQNQSIRAAMNSGRSVNARPSYLVRTPKPYQSKTARLTLAPRGTYTRGTHFAAEVVTQAPLAEAGRRW
jgi:RHS repeat-associated protein